MIETLLIKQFKSGHGEKGSSSLARPADVSAGAAPQTYEAASVGHDDICSCHAPTNPFTL